MEALLSGQVAAVTGAGRGLGRAYAVALAAAGARVVVNDIDAAPAEEVVATIAATGGEAVPDVGSIAERAGAERLVALTRSTFGRIDIMVTNAGADRRGPVLDLDPADFEFTLGVHLWGTIHCSVAAGRAMREQGAGGCIVNVTSPAFYQGTPALAPYCTAKGAIYGFMRTLALELAPLGIAVNAVAPPLTTTGPVVAFLESLPAMGMPVDQIEAMRSMAQDPADVAPAVVFLASEAGRRQSGNVYTLTRDSLTRVGPPAEIPVALDGWGDQAVGRAIDRLPST
ncbi:MAG: SDR family NAD(P)-dependent oxidoreductase [Acidimicrobiia bacterium]